jgi:predicted metalloprotease with PDZ domain
MAEVIAAARRDRRPPLVVGIMGQGHVEYRYGVTHQLAALGVDDVATALPWHVDADCRMPNAAIADAVFGVAPPSTLLPPPRLGVMVSVVDNGVRIEQVIPQSIADATGLQVGDVIENAAGVSVRRPADLVAVIRRQAPGTWLPLTVRRAEQVYELLARFPTEP